MLAMHQQPQGPSSQGRERSSFSKAQMEARLCIRKVNGLRQVLQALQYRRKIDQVDAVRYHASLVFIGLAQDREINDLLAKMGVSQIVGFLLQCSEEQQIRIRSSSSRVQDKNYLLFRTFSRQLMSLLCPGQSSASSDAAVSGIAQMNIDKELIVSSSKLSYDPKQLLVLIRDHLISEGYTAAAEQLNKDASLALSAAHDVTDGQIVNHSDCSSSVMIDVSDDMLNKIRVAKKMPIDSPDTARLKCDHHQKSSAISVHGKRSADQMLHSDSTQSANINKKANSSSSSRDISTGSLRLKATEAVSPTAGKCFTPFTSPSYFSPSSEASKVVNKKGSQSSIAPSAKKYDRREPNKSSLSCLVENYLRFQVSSNILP
jgi:hypothetical protein